MTTKIVSATSAKLHFGSLMETVKKGTPVVIEKNSSPEIVWISMDDYEDFLEIHDEKFQKGIEKDFRKMKKGTSGTLDTLYALHRHTIEREAN